MATKEHVVGFVKLDEKIQKKFWYASLFVWVLWGVPGTTWLFFDYVALQGPFIIPFVRVPFSAGHLTTKLSKSEIQIV